MLPKNFSYLWCSIRSGGSSEKPIFDENEVFLGSCSPKKWIVLKVGLQKLEVLSQSYMFIKKISVESLEMACIGGHLWKVYLIWGRPFYEPGHVNLNPVCPGRSSQSLLNLTYVIEGSILRILTQTVSKNIDPSIFYEHFTKSPKNDPFQKRGS